MNIGFVICCLVKILGYYCEFEKPFDKLISKSWYPPNKLLREM